MADCLNYFILNVDKKFGPFSQALDPPPPMFNVKISIKTRKSRTWSTLDGGGGAHLDFFFQGKKGGISSKYGNSC